MRFPWRTSYLKVANTDRSSSDLENDERTGFLKETLVEGSKQSASNPGSNRLLIIITSLNAIFFILSSTLFGTWFYNEYLVLNGRLRNASSYSPVHDRLDLGAEVKKLNGTLFPPLEEPSVARQMPNPEADAVWAEWELTRVLPVTADQIRKMGKDPETVAKLEDKDWGLGDDAYVATLDVFHQLHCLNQLREIAYSGYYNKTKEHLVHPELWEVHINHCVDMLMQTIQCSGNVNLITMHWVETQFYPFPDMSINKQCIDFERLTQWRIANTIDMDKYVEIMLKPEGVKQLPAPDQYYEYFERPNPNHMNGTNADEDFNM